MRSKTLVLGIIFSFLMAFPVQAQRVMEKLTRGLIAAKTTSGYFLSWRLLGTEYGSTIAFNVYKGSTKLNTTPITNATCFDDNSSGTGEYSVKAVLDGQEQSASVVEHLLSDNYLSIPLQNASGYVANDASCGDLDGDGQYEIVLKEENNPQDNTGESKTGQPKLTAYKLSGTKLWRIDLGINIREGAHYTQFMVYDLDGDGCAEIACKTAPGSKDASGNYLKLGPAATANHATDYRDANGRILTGPEYYTIFSGKTGLELATIDYKGARGKVDDWGDNYGNRCDRFLACVAYLDGIHPSVVPCRGYYAKSTLWALDFRDGKLTERWFFDSNVSGNSKAAGQGCHGISVGDVDNDGKDEIVYGGATIDDNGKLLGSSGVGHGDAQHLADIDPDHPGLEFWQAHEAGQCADLRDPSQPNGGVIFSKPGTNDVGRACTADITAEYRGMECWASTGVGFYTCKGVPIPGTAPSSQNFLCWWDGDLLRELLDGTTISKYGAGTLLTATGCSSNNSTKATPCLSADLFGDWREEVIWKCGNTLRIYTTTIPTTNRLYTLMHDPQYRLSIAWQNVAYNQPPHTGFYLGDGMGPAPKPAITYPGSPLALKVIRPAYIQTRQSEFCKVIAGQTFVLPVTGYQKTVKIYDLSGHLVKEIAANKTVINLRDYGICNGVYMAKLPVTKMGTEETGL